MSHILPEDLEKKRRKLCAILERQVTTLKLNLHTVSKLDTQTEKNKARAHRSTEEEMTDDDEVKSLPKHRKVTLVTKSITGPTSDAQEARSGTKRPRENDEAQDISIDAKIAKLTHLAELKAAKYVEDLQESLKQVQHAELDKWLEAAEREEDRGN